MKYLIGMLIVVIVIFSTNITLNVYKCGNSYYLKLGKREYCIPKSSAIYMSSSEGVFRYLVTFGSHKLDSNKDQEILVVPAKEIEDSMKQSGVKANKLGNSFSNLRFLVFSLDRDELEKAKRMTPVQIDEILGLGEWAEKSKFSHTSVFSRNNWFSLSFDTDQDGNKDGSWYILKVNPELGRGVMSKPGVLVGVCANTSATKYNLPPSCHTKYIDEINMLLFTFWISEENLHLRDQIGKFLSNKLSSWEIRNSEYISGRSH